MGLWEFIRQNKKYWAQKSRDDVRHTVFNAYIFFSPLQTNKASAQGDFQGASAASRQALWLSILSIVFGIITYICAIAALISYLSGKPP